MSVVFGFFHPTCFLGSSMMMHITVVHSCLSPTNILLCEYPVCQSSVGVHFDGFLFLAIKNKSLEKKCIHACVTWSPCCTAEKIKKKIKTKKNKSLGVPVLAQHVKDPMLSLRRCRFDPWPCSVG